MYVPGLDVAEDDAAERARAFCVRDVRGSVTFAPGLAPVTWTCSALPRATTAACAGAAISALAHAARIAARANRRPSPRRRIYAIAGVPWGSASSAACRSASENSVSSSVPPRYAS